MRYLTVLLEPDGETAFHPLGGELTDDPAITRRAIHRVELLDDDTVLLLAEASGSKQRYREIMDASPHVVDYLVSGDDRWMAVSQFELTERARRPLELQREEGVVIDTPMRFTAGGGLKVTCLGDDAAFERLFDRIDEAEGTSVEIREMGEYEPDESSFTRLFTARQEEVLEAAVELGYYRVPRDAELADIADAVGISRATASEHLRKVEERVFSEIVH
jgi:predicted DNA binding protein